MSEEIKVKPTHQHVCQNTGNPVLDSLVNLLSAMSLAGYVWNEKVLKEIHKMLLEVSEQEPGGLRRWDDTTQIH